MRIRTAVFALVVAATGVVALATPAQAAANHRVCQTPARAHHAAVCLIPRRPWTPHTGVPRR